MVIEKGKEWARRVGTNLDPVVVSDSAEFAALAFAELGAGVGTGHRTAITPRSGSLLTTVGLDHPRTDQAMAYDLDLVVVTLDEDRKIPMVATMIVPPGATSDGVAAMNVPWWRTYRVAPRAHPNDGLVDILVGRVPLSQWPEARRRARTGTHVPHPSISITRTSSWHRDFNRRRWVWIDGRRVGRSRSIGISIIPDAATMVA